MKHRPRKRFGQNFLKDEQIIQQIIDAVCLQREDNLLEIGPGMGALSMPLLQSVDKLKVIEIDRDLQAYLKTLAPQERLEIFNEDALDVDYSQFGEQLRVVGNLPYNISTPLIMHLLDYRSHIKDMHFMLQKEVVERMAAEPGSKAYGRLSVMLQYYCSVQYLFTVPPTAFNPEPKVQSAVVRIKPYEHRPYEAIEHQVLKSLVTQAFSMRRKTLANNLKKTLNAEQLIAIGVDPGLRPEQISIEKYIQIAKLINK